MCGICGRLDFALTRSFPEARLRAWSAVMAHRGPDEDGCFSRPGVGLAMRRLSIIDLAGGQQPLANEDGSVQVVMNGEIYNYREVRSALEGQGHQFRTQSDTEVVVHLWEEYGNEAFTHLRGMFAIAIWDERQQTLVLARDRLGIKPLYYHQHHAGLDFASEIKVLLALSETPRDLDPTSLAAYFTIGYIPPPETVFRAIRELEPGHLLHWSPGHAPTIAPYWRLTFDDAPDRTEAEWLEILDAAVRDAVQSHLVSDVPLAAFLSGGLDSASVVAYMQEDRGDPARTFTVRYLGAGSGPADESGLAAMIAERYGTRHTVLDVAPHVSDILDRVVRSFDQPHADESSVPTFYLTEAVAREVKVALSGLGGDELFGGYERHAGMQVSRAVDRLPAWLGAALGATAARAIPPLAGGGLRGDRLQRFAKSLGRPAAERYLGFITRLWPEEVAGLLTLPDADAELPERVTTRLTRHFGAASRTPVLNRALAMDYGQYLPGDILPLTDRLSMHHSLEVRVPFVDHELVELAARIPPALKVRGTTKKVVLRHLMAERLPPAFMHAPKRGFVGPTAAWLRTDLREMFMDSLNGRVVHDGLWLDGAAVRRMTEHHMEGRSDRFGPTLWALLMYARWHALYVAEPSPPLW